MSTRLLSIDPGSYQIHDLHGTDRAWDQTNCSVDVWIEVLHALGLEPLAAAAFTVAVDFDGDQWEFFKYPSEDLWSVYGIDVHEMNPWRGVLAHIEDQLRLGRFMTVEVDSWFLPDTAGVSYRIGHVKSTIVVNEIDPAARRMAYFHNSGYHRLDGEDFDGVFGLGEYAGHREMPPYTEVVRLEALRRSEPAELRRVGRELLTRHLALRPTVNPVEPMAALVDAAMPALAEGGPDAFHDLAFATVRQCGASTEVAAAFCTWLIEPGSAGGEDPDSEHLRTAAEHWTAMATTSKSLQLRLARAARGRSTSLAEGWTELAAHWQLAQASLDRLGER